MKKIILFLLLLTSCRVQNIEGDRIDHPNLWFCYRTMNRYEVCARTLQVCQSVQDRVEQEINIPCRLIER